jgi:exopolyphosphatase/guanosine-5'-triphosphate,3'-diphosphate pyrophosphatase
LVRVSSIDLGSNSTRLLVADVNNGEIKTLLKTHRVTQMAEKLEETYLISEQAQKRVLNALKFFLKTSTKYQAEHIYVVGTAAMRDARNAEQFIDLINNKLGIVVEIVSGEQEGVLTSLGVLNSFPEIEEYVIVDIGGRSTELISKYKKDFNSLSFNIGVVSLTEKFFKDLPINEINLINAKNYINEIFSSVQFKDTNIIGVAGTFLSLASIINRQTKFNEAELHRTALLKEQINQITNEILSLKEFEIFSNYRGIDPKRSSTITSGIVMVNELINRYNIKTIKVSNSDILEGLILKKY